MTSRRITIVASELLGRAGTGGAGTADSLLAIALGRSGHRVRLLVATGREIGTLDPEWRARYSSAGVEVEVLEQLRDVRPAYLRPPFEVFRALRAEPPEVLIVDDWRGLGYAALRSRELGSTLQETACIVHCHGPARVLAEFAQKVPDTLARFGEEVAERASIGLADAVVSPSDWLLRWMRAHGWPVPDSAQVIQYVRQSTALGETPVQAERAAPIRRLAFFGQLREGKGIRIFLEALGAIEPALLDGVELVFLGRTTPRWTQERVLGALPRTASERLAAVRFEIGLERSGAIAELMRQGTLAVMPSLLDNSPNTVSECLEHGIPFVSTMTGGIPELVAEEDRGRVLCRPASGDLAAALARALGSPGAPARPARDSGDSLASWLELVETVRPRPPRAVEPARGVAIVASGENSTRQARRLAGSTTAAAVEIVSAVSRRDGLSRASAGWLVFLDEGDVPDDTMVDVLVAAQAASGADVVTAAVRPADDPDAIQLFLGDPGSLGLIENQYGVVGLVRRSSLTTELLPGQAADPDWLLFAGLRLRGARIVSLPEPVAAHSGPIGRIDDVPGDGLSVLDRFEGADARQLPDLPQLAATLGAAHARLGARPSVGEARPLLLRAWNVLRTDGVDGLIRRARARAQ